MFDKIFNLPQKICFVIASFFVLNGGDRIIDFGGKTNADNLAIFLGLWLTVAFVIFLPKK